jgi:hypothetical protein
VGVKMTDNIIKFQKPVDLHKELHFRMNVVSTAEKIYVEAMSLPANSMPIELGNNVYLVNKILELSETFHEIAQLYIDEIMAKIEKEQK